MSWRGPKLLVSVKQKLFAGFLTMTLLMAGLGGYAVMSIDNADHVVTDTFDRPLMAVNFARSASQTFKALELEALERELSGPETHNDDRLDGEASDPSLDRFDQLSDRFTDDLEVARDRSIAPRADPFFDQVERDFQIWNDRIQGQAKPRTDEAKALAESIEENLDIVVELQTNQSFRNRESAINTMAQLRNYTAYAVVAALVLTVGLSLWLVLTIIRPLKAAARVAAQISSGRFNVTIPKGGEDETGQLLRTMSTMQSNIRDRMESEQSLRTLAQNRLADSLDNSKDAVLLTDVDDRIIFANPGVADLFGAMLPETVTGKLCRSYFGADGVPVNLEEINIDTGNVFQLPDQRWVRVNASATREGGQLFIWSDVTEARERAEQLRIALIDAQAANRAKTLFLAAMGHELNTPLNAIVGLSDVLQREYSGSDGNPSHVRMAELISQSGSHIAEMVRDMLEIANDDHTPVDSESLPQTDLRMAVDQALHKHADLAKKQTIRVIWSPPETACPVAGELEDLTQIIGKLVDNGLKFNRPGGALKVQISTDADKGHSLHIVDSGLGIEAEQFERILEPFIQIERGYKRSVDGSGLGLTIVDRIVRRLGAKLSIRSVVGKGSVFTVRFPPTSFSVQPVDQSRDHREAA